MISNKKKKHNNITHKRKQTQNPEIKGKRLPNKNGWIRVSIYGEPYERGYAHGVLLSKEINYVRSIFSRIVQEKYNHKVSLETFMRDCVTHVKPIIKEKFPEYYKEMQGISDGSKTNIDFIVSWNCVLSMYNFYDINDDKEKNGRCSAFIACGKGVTETGDIVMAHNTHASFTMGETCNVILTVKPEKGNTMIMQISPGFIASGQDWFLCDNGIIGCETTIGDIKYKPNFGVPYFCRIREAMQYGNSLDDYVKIMLHENAGDYACSWLLGDTRNGEIMLLELGKKIHNVQRTKHGIFYGMNSAIHSGLRDKETTDSDIFDISTSSGARNARFQTLLKHDYYGRINTENAKKIMGDHYDVFQGKETGGNSRTICRHSYLDNSGKKKYYPHGSVDSKVVDTILAKKMQFIGRFGPGCGKRFNAQTFKRKHPEYKKLVLGSMSTQKWTMFL